MPLPQLDIQGPIARITLQRPEVANKLAPEDLLALRHHLRTVNEQSDVRVLVLQAQGRHFCSGYDIADMLNSQRPGQGFGDMVDALAACRPVTIAAIQGGVFGGGTDMALACDFRVGVPQARIFMPAARLGLHFYQSGMQRFISRLGLNMAKRLFLTAEALDSSAMHACGFLTHLVEEGQLETAVNALADTLIRMAPLALLGMKDSLNQLAAASGDAKAAADLAALIEQRVQRTIASQDLQEAIDAWQQRREPVFRGL